MNESMNESMNGPINEQMNQCTNERTNERVGVVLLREEEPTPNPMVRFGGISVRTTLSASEIGI